MGRPYEAILINDGSRNASLPLLLRQRALRPDVIRIIDSITISIFLSPNIFFIPSV